MRRTQGLTLVEMLIATAVFLTHRAAGSDREATLACPRRSVSPDGGVFDRTEAIAAFASLMATLPPLSLAPATSRVRELPFCRSDPGVGEA